MTSRLLVLVIGGLAASGCGLVSRTPIPPPLSPGAPYGEVVREIRIDGAGHTKEYVIRDRLITRVGEPYMQSDALSDHQRLTELGIFTAISFDTEPVEGGIVLTVRLDETTTYLPTISFLLTQENGVELGPGVISPNLFGRAAFASAYARFGASSRNAAIGYQDNWRPTGRRFNCCYRFQYAHRERDNDLDDFEEVSDELSFQFLYAVNSALSIGPRVSMMAIGEQARRQVGPPVTLNPYGRDRIPGVGLVVEYDDRNVSNYPTRGWYLDISATQYGGPLGGTVDYPRLEADLRGYLELAGPDHSLAYYSLMTFTDGTMGVDIPIHQDFHLGGTNSVRGWPLGSRVGKSQWLNTLEYWWNAVPPSAYRVSFIRWSMGLQLAAFADAGTAWNGTGDFHANWIGGGGVGARLTIPQVGFLRFDLALRSKDPWLGVEFHVGGGERATAQKNRVR